MTSLFSRRRTPKRAGRFKPPVPKLIKVFLLLFLQKKKFLLIFSRVFGGFDMRLQLIDGVGLLQEGHLILQLRDIA
jgi:hypothetical protein